MKNKKKYLLILILMVLFTGINVYAEDSCTGIFGNPEEEGTLMYLFVNDIFRPVQMLVPVLFLILTTVDFAKVVFSNSKDGLEKAKSHLIKRSIIAVVIFFIPVILELVFSIVDNVQIKSCIENFK